MTRDRRSAIAGILLGVAIALAGCGERGVATNPKGAVPPSDVVMTFRDEHAPTIKSHGKIVPLSVEEQAGFLHYQTEDGKKWRVSWKTLPTQDFQFGTPEPAN